MRGANGRATPRKAIRDQRKEGEEKKKMKKEEKGAKDQQNRGEDKGCQEEVAEEREPPLKPGDTGKKWLIASLIFTTTISLVLYGRLRTVESTLASVTQSRRLLEEDNRSEFFEAFPSICDASDSSSSSLSCLTDITEDETDNETLNSRSSLTPSLATTDDTDEKTQNYAQPPPKEEFRRHGRAESKWQRGRQEEEGTESSRARAGGEQAQKRRDNYDISWCDVERRSWISVEEFEREFKGHKPLILTNATKDWRRGAFEEEELVEKYGNVLIKTGFSSFFPLAGGVGYEKLTLRDYFNYMKDEGLRGKTEEPMYLFERGDFFNYATDLRAEIIPPPALHHFDVQRIYSFLGVGAGLTGVQFHKHNDAMNVIIKGRKRWLLYPAGEWPPFDFTSHLPLTYWIDHLLPLLPPERRPMQCVQEEGELFYVPESCYHAVLNLEDTTAIASQIHHPQTAYGQALARASAIEEEGNKEREGESEVEYEERKRQAYREAAWELYKLDSMTHHCLTCKTELIRVLRLAGETDECMRVASAALEADRWIASNWASFGHCLGDLGHIDHGIEALSFALTLDTSDSFALNSLATLLERKGDHEGAEREREKSWEQWRKADSHLQNLREIQDEIYERLVMKRPPGFAEINPREEVERRRIEEWEQQQKAAAAALEPTAEGTSTDASQEAQR